MTRLGVLTEMLASVGNLRDDIMKEMVTQARGSCHKTTRSTEVLAKTWVQAHHVGHEWLIMLDLGAGTY